MKCSVEIPNQGMLEMHGNALPCLVTGIGLIVKEHQITQCCRRLITNGRPQSESWYILFDPSVIGGQGIVCILFFDFSCVVLFWGSFLLTLNQP